MTSVCAEAFARPAVPERRIAPANAMALSRFKSSILVNRKVLHHAGILVAQEVTVVDALAGKLFEPQTNRNGAVDTFLRAGSRWDVERVPNLSRFLNAID